MIHAFTGTPDGQNPQSSLLDVNGTLYGTTISGGHSSCDCGTVYTLTAGGHYHVIYRFRGGKDAEAPFGALTDAGGTLYGTSALGGIANACSDSGCGTVYSLTPGGVARVVYTFRGDSDGGMPLSRLTKMGGVLYGTTLIGGNTGCEYTGCGTVFSVTPSGSKTTVYTFNGGDDGSSPRSGLLKVGEILYGTTSTGGGTGCGGSGCGTVYSVTPAGAEQIVYSFSGGNDGANPSSDLVDVAGTLYGTTPSGGGSGCGGSGCGTVFSLTTAGVENIVYAFAGGSDGSAPQAGLLYDGHTLYGTTSMGGDSRCNGGCGTLYSMTLAGTEKILHAFKAGTDGGWNPVAAPTVVHGTLYGTTNYGGSGFCPLSGGADPPAAATHCGAVFKLTP